MTKERLEKAQIAQKNIQDISNILESIEKIKIINGNQKNQRTPFLRFANILKSKDGKNVQEATILLFDGINSHGTEIPVDDHLLICLRNHYMRMLQDACEEFAKIWILWGK